MFLIGCKIVRDLRSSAYFSSFTDPNAGQLINMHKITLRNIFFHCSTLIKVYYRMKDSAELLIFDNSWLYIGKLQRTGI